MAYCNDPCLKSNWGDHRGTCKQEQNDKKEREAKEDMGSLLNALMPPPQPQRYDEVYVWNA